jgi:hypothetical protein
LDAISRNRVAFRVARLDKHGLPRETHRLFAPCPRHSLHARRAIHGPGGLFFDGPRHPAAPHTSPAILAQAGCFLRSILPRASLVTGVTLKSLCATPRWASLTKARPTPRSPRECPRKG